MTLKYLLIIDFPKFDPLTAAKMALWEILSQNVKIYSPWSQTKRNRVKLSLRLSRIEFSLVSD
jgi:hypothetical protein